MAIETASAQADFANAGAASAVENLRILWRQMSTETQHGIKEQLPFPLTVTEEATPAEGTYRARLQALLQGELDFHTGDSKYATHAIHAFPAKFPPQLPRHFIEGLTRRGEVVLDPMSGSGTTLIEAYLAGRQALGLDIDPLALRIARVKTAPVNSARISASLAHILETVRRNLAETDEESFERAFAARFNEETRRFIRYWFAPQTRRVLFFLSEAIRSVADDASRHFFEVAFSAIIITKRGGVSLALDLAHTRPHRAKIVYDADNSLLLNESGNGISPRRLKFLTKRLRPVLSAFENRVKTNLQSALTLGKYPLVPHVAGGNAQALPLPDESVDLIVTSPPYASNAIDYMRAHKFSLVWLGYPIRKLSRQRKKYIGGESILQRQEHLPAEVAAILSRLQGIDPKKAEAVRRYYIEMKDVLGEMYRVLKPGKAAILVVGTSVMRGIDIRIADCLAAIGRERGFEVPAIGERALDRNRRMLPTGARLDKDSQIQQRMHKEFVIGFYKPPKGEQPA